MVQETDGHLSESDRSEQMRRSDRHEERRTRRAQAAPFDVFFGVLVLLAVAKASYARTLILHTSWLSAGFLLEVAAIVLLLGLADMVLPRRNYAPVVVVFSLLSLAMLANVIYVSVFGQIVDPSMLAMAGQTAEVSDSVLSILRPGYLAFVIDLPFVIAAAVILRRRFSGVVGRSRLVAIALLSASAVLAVQVALVMRLPVGVDGLAVGKSRGLVAFQVSRLIPRKASAPGPAALVTPAIAGENPAHLYQRQVEAVRQADSGVRIASFPSGAYAGKNVILIQFEALNGFVIGKRYQGASITPNLDKLIGEGWYFPNTYSETGAGNTSDAEFISNSSLYAPTNMPASTTYSIREIPALPRLLGKMGYTSLTLHANVASFWNRAEMYAALGFNRVYDQKYFRDEDKMWRASDEVLFKRGSEALRSAAASTPVYANFITMTSHNPFKYPGDQTRIPVKVSAQDRRTMAGRYMGSISYSDKALGQFVAKLKADGLYDKSIIIVIGDHTAMSPDTLTKGDKQVMASLIGRPYNLSDVQRVGMIVHLPGQTRPERIEGTLGTVDVMPTVADLVGLDLSSTPHFGKSAFVGSPGLVPTRSYLPAGSFVNDSVVFKPQLSFEDGSAFSVVDGTATTPSGTEHADFDRTAALSLLSDQWLNSLPRRPDAAATQGLGF